jgi:hypothetical protein
MTVVNIGDLTSKEALFEIAAILGGRLWPGQSVVNAIARLVEELDQEQERVRVLERDLALADEEIGYLTRMIRGYP